MSVVDELPAGTRREALFAGGGFVCLFDPRRVRLPRRLTTATYLAHDHVVVSYNGDLRGVVEDVLGLERRVRVSVASFQNVGAIVEGTALLATVPETVAREILALHPKLRQARLPFRLGGTPMELVWRGAIGEDDAVRFVRDRIQQIAHEVTRMRRRSPIADRAARR